MRVLLVSHRFPPDGLGGVERYTQTLAAELTRRGDLVSIFTRRTQRDAQEAGYNQERLSDGTIVHRLVSGSVSSQQVLRDHERAEQSFTMAMLQAAPELVHINHLLGLSPRLIHIAHRLGAAVVVSLHDFHFACSRVHLRRPSGEQCAGPDQGRSCARYCFLGNSEFNEVLWALRTVYFQRALAMADCVVAYSEYVRSYFSRFLAQRINLIANGVPDRWLTQAPPPRRVRRPEESITIAYCGTVAAHKGPHVILEALRLARLPAVRLLLFGETPDEAYRDELKRKAKAVPGLVLSMYGAYEQDKLALLLHDVDFLVSPSLVPEAGPIAPREALALGIPVLAARLGALPEIIEEGRNGFTFDPTAPRELASLLRRVAQDPTLMAELRDGAVRTRVAPISAHVAELRLRYTDALLTFGQNGVCPAGASECELFHRALEHLTSDSIRKQGAAT
jgi:glycosyltransferase involved in cell wall biosynthesis